MANEEVVGWRFQGQNEVTPASDEAIEAINKLAKAIEEQGQQAKTTTDDNKKATESTEKLGNEQEKTARKTGALTNMLKNKTAAIGAFVVSSGLALLSLNKLATATAAYSKEGSEQSAIEQNLADSIRRKAGSIKEAKADYEAIIETINAFSDATGTTDEELIKSSEEVVRVLGRTKIATSDLATIQGIATKTGKGFTDATKEYIKVAKGDIGALKELTSLTKDQVAKLEQIKDGSKRAARAVELLTQTYGGETKAVDTARLAITKLDNAKGDLRQQIGKVINSSGLLEATLNPLHDQLRLIEKDIGDNSEEYQRLAITIAENVVTGLRIMFDIGWRIVELYQNMKIGAVGIKVTMQEWAKSGEVSALTVEQALTELANKSLQGVIDKFDVLFAQTEKIAQLAGLDSLASGISTARDEVGKLSSGLQDLEANAQSKLVQAQKEYLDLQKAGQKEIAQTIKDFEGVNKVGQAINKTFDKVQSSLAGAKVTTSGNLGPDFNRNDGAGGTTGATGATKNEQKRLALQTQIEELNKRAIEARASGNKLALLNIEYAKRQLEIEQQTASIKDANLRQLTKTNALETARLDLQDKQKALQKEQLKTADEQAQKDAANQAAQLRLAAFKETDLVQKGLLEIEARRIELNASLQDGAQKQLELARLQREEQALIAQKEAERFDLWVEALGGLQLDTTIFSVEYSQAVNAEMERQRDLTQEQNEALREQIALRQEQAQRVNDLATGVGQYAKSIVQLTKLQFNFNKAQDASLGALEAGVKIGGALTSLFVEDQKKRAAISAGINAAAAIGAYALFAETLLPNYLTAGIQYTSAAVQYGLIAGGAGAVSRPSVGGAGSSARQAPARSQEQVIDATTTSLVEKLEENNRARAGSVTNFDLRGAGFIGDDPNAMQFIGNLVQPVVEQTATSIIEDREL